MARGCRVAPIPLVHPAGCAARPSLRGCILATGDPCRGPLPAKETPFARLPSGSTYKLRLCPQTLRPSEDPEVGLSPAPRPPLQPQGNIPARSPGRLADPTRTRGTFFRERSPHPPPSLERNSKTNSAAPPHALQPGPCAPALPPTYFHTPQLHSTHQRPGRRRPPLPLSTPPRRKLHGVLH